MAGYRNEHKIKGKVYLIGAGQGDRELITLKADRILRKADIIFYDSLVSFELIDDCKGKKIFVGKRACNHHIEQDKINRLLYEAAFKYQIIARIKGGDPMVFGHAGEEIAYLESRSVEVEVIPGICAALSASALSKIPLTMRNISSSVAFCSAHDKASIPVPNSDAIVYFMGAHNVKEIVKALLHKGRPETTPIALIHDIGGKNENVTIKNLSDILNENMVYTSPMLIIVSETANRQNWYKAFYQRVQNEFHAITNTCDYENHIVR